MSKTIRHPVSATRKSLWNGQPARRGLRAASAIGGDRALGLRGHELRGAPSVNNGAVIALSDSDEGDVRGSIVFWGAPASGKTTFIARMFLRPDDADESDEWQVTAGDADSADYVANALKEIERTGTVRPTQVTNRPFRFLLQRRYRRLLLRRTDEWEIVVLDPKGEIFLPDRFDPSLYKLAADATGFALMVDPSKDDAQDQHWDMLLGNIHWFAREMRKRSPSRRALDQHNRIRIPVAVCLTKMDLFPDHGDPGAFMRERLGPAHELIKSSFLNYRIFACSALGASPGLHGGESRPWGLLPPLRWLTEAARSRPLSWRPW